MATTKTTGKAVGGLARASSMTAEQRSESARKAAKAKAELASLPKTTHIGTLQIGDVAIPCAVLEDGRRVLSETGITQAMLGSRSGASKRLKSAGAPLPMFVAPGQLKPFINKELEDGLLSPIRYVQEGKATQGFSAEILPVVCNVWLAARQAGALQSQQMDKAQKAEILMRGLATIGIIALVDEATGYQRDRAKDALAKILETFVAKELQPYVQTFPADFYEEMFRLRGLKYPPENPKFRPQYFGVLTNDVVYERLAPGLLEELKKQAKKDEKKAHLHRRLTQEVGHPKLREHLASVVTAMKLSNDYTDFISKLNRIHPRFGKTLSLDLEDGDR